MFIFETIIFYRIPPKPNHQHFTNKQYSNFIIKFLNKKKKKKQHVSNEALVSGLIFAIYLQQFSLSFSICSHLLFTHKLVSPSQLSTSPPPFQLCFCFQTVLFHLYCFSLTPWLCMLIFSS